MIKRVSKEKKKRLKKIFTYFKTDANPFWGSLDKELVKNPNFSGKSLIGELQMKQFMHIAHLKPTVKPLTCIPHKSFSNFYYRYILFARKTHNLSNI